MALSKDKIAEAAKHAKELGFKRFEVGEHIIGRLWMNWFAVAAFDEEDPTPEIVIRSKDRGAGRMIVSDAMVGALHRWRAAQAESTPIRRERAAEARPSKKK